MSGGRECAAAHGATTLRRLPNAGLPFILNIVVVLGFFVVAFAIIGLESLSASLRRRCVWQVDGSLYVPPSPEQATFCNLDNAYKGGLRCSAIDPGLTCRDIGRNSDFARLQNFDNIWHAVYTVFQLTSIEGW